MGGSRLVTLSGAGGAGKTRLAQRAVALGRAAGTGTDVAWADLSPLRNAHLLAATVADALGLSDHTPRLPADAVCAWIGDRSTLLVLDSCEHLPAECRDLAGDLLTACPNLRILATSREPLRVRGEAVVEIEPFASAAEAVALIAFLAGRPHDSVRHARAALDAKRHIGDAFGIAMVMDLLAIALADAGEEPAAAYAFGAAARFWETVGHPQRGTPEMAALRGDCEDRLVRRMGLKRYGQTFRRAAAADARSLVSWGAYGGPVPEQ
ncbi:hypothetical protein ACWDFR_31945 [Streptomyces sp. 900105755]